MNKNEYNSNVNNLPNQDVKEDEVVVDVPYYTRDLSKNNNFKIARRYIRSENILTYLKEIDNIKCDKEYFQTKNLQEIFSRSARTLR